MENNKSNFNWSKPSSIIQSVDTNLSKLSPKTPSGPLTPPASNSISDSFKRMGLGGVGSLGGRMGELEKASLRLGQFKAMKTAEEQEKDIAAKKEMEKTRIRAEMQMQERRIQAERDAAMRAR
jgi:hypothetical protein